jgi:hypothetical protein
MLLVHTHDQMSMTLESVLACLGAGFVLYAETHYSFKGIYSRLKKREPEIIADAPHRVEPGQAVPILLLVKDAHRFPVTIRGVAVTVRAQDGKTWRHNLPLQDLIVTKPLWWRVFPVEVQERGRLSFDVEIEYSVGGKKRRCLNDNHIATSHEPLSVWVASDPLPREAGWVYGDLHTHSSYTSDQVEFGAPLAAAVELAKALGLQFFAVTDHSYDLDDHHDDYLTNDPDLSKWKALWQEVEELNGAQRHVVILPGEEVSCGNARGRNVHFLVLNSRRFFPGSGDSAERWLRSRPEMTIAEILAQLDKDALAIAGHPSARPPFLQRLLIRRGHWEDVDCLLPNLTGLQVWNGSEVGLKEGVAQWVRCLLKGQRIYLYGGNDAHGNFNRFRQVGFPFFTMREHHDHLFGRVRTAAKVEGRPSVAGLLDALRAGRCIATDGPFVSLEFETDRGDITPVGGTAHGSGRLRIRALSTPEFGPLWRVVVYRGAVGADNEAVEQQVDRFEDAYSFEASIPVEAVDGRRYFRVEVFSGDAADPRRGLSNPVWVG